MVTVEKVLAIDWCEGDCKDSFPSLLFVLSTSIWKIQVSHITRHEKSV